MTTPFDEEAALSFNPFEGDYGDGERRIINEIITAPEPPRCHHCHGRIKEGTRIRRLIETTADLEDMPAGGQGEITEADLAAYERRRTEYLFCEPCCQAMVVYGTDRDWAGDRYERRTQKYRKTS